MGNVGSMRWLVACVGTCTCTGVIYLDLSCSILFYPALPVMSLSHFVIQEEEDWKRGHVNSISTDYPR